MARPGDMKPAAEALATRFADLTADEFEEACREFWQTYGTLPRPLPKLRRKALRVMRDDAIANGVKIGFLAKRLGFTPNRFSRLTAAEVTS